jgi:hypothetical protein
MGVQVGVAVGEGVSDEIAAGFVGRVEFGRVLGKA